MTTTIEIYENDVGDYTCSTAKKCAEMLKNGVIEPDAKLIHSFEASTWLEAMEKYYEIMGFGKYNPSNDENGVIDPVLLELLDEREDLK